MLPIADVLLGRHGGAATLESLNKPRQINHRPSADEQVQMGRDDTQRPDLDPFLCADESQVLGKKLRARKIYQRRPVPGRPDNMEIDPMSHATVWCRTRRSRASRLRDGAREYAERAACGSDCAGARGSTCGSAMAADAASWSLQISLRAPGQLGWPLPSSRIRDSLARDTRGWASESSRVNPRLGDGRRRGPARLPI